MQDLSLERHFLKPNVVFWGKVAEGMRCWERESVHQLIELLFPGLFVLNFHTKSLSYSCRGFLAVCSQCFCFTDGICLTQRISVNNGRPKSLIFILRANSVWLRVPEHQASMLKSNPQTPWDASDSSNNGLDYSSIKSRLLAAQDGANNVRNARGAGKRSPLPMRGLEHQREPHPVSKGSERGIMAGRLAGSTEGSFVHRSQRCSVPALSGQMAGQHLLIRQEADKKYDLSLSQHGFSSSFFFQPVECVQSIISAWY